MIASLAGAWGRCIGRYSLAAVTESSLVTAMDTPVPAEPCIWLGWHEGNLITIALHRRVVRRPAVALVPSGVSGAAMRGWLAAVGIAAIALPNANRPAGALRSLRAALETGHDVLIAADGPGGPRRGAKAGPLWLARAAGVEVRPVGCAATPALRLPRWDRHLVPLPGAKIAAVFAHPLSFEGDPRSEAARASVDRALDRLCDRAACLLRPEAKAGRETTKLGNAR